MCSVVCGWLFFWGFLLFILVYYFLFKVNYDKWLEGFFFCFYFVYVLEIYKCFKVYLWVNLKNYLYCDIYKGLRMNLDFIFF